MSIQSGVNLKDGMDILQIASLCFEISARTNHDAFFSFEPHCNLVCVRFYKNGWKYVHKNGLEDKEDFYFSEDIYLDFDDGKIQCLKKNLLKILEEDSDGQ